MLDADDWVHFDPDGRITAFNKWHGEDIALPHGHVRVGIMSIPLQPDGRIDVDGVKERELWRGK
jgi:hypothetical protein